MKYSILMPYHKRATQLHNTLISLKHHYHNRSDYEVILTEDVKNANDVDEHKLLNKTLDHFSSTINIIHLVGGRTDYWGPVLLFNLAASNASGQFFIITNPECFHRSNILNGLDKEFSINPNVYVVCGCLHVVKYKRWINSFEELGGQTSKWYQHSKHRNAMLHFCTALSKDNWITTGGFDERFTKGLAYEDNAFRDSIKKAGIQFVIKDDVLTIHQDHGGFPRPPNYQSLVARNRSLYKSNR